MSVVWAVIGHYWQYFLAGGVGIFLSLSAKYHKSQNLKLKQENQLLERKVEDHEQQDQFQEAANIRAETAQKHAEKIADKYHKILKDTDPSLLNDADLNSLLTDRQREGTLYGSTDEITSPGKDDNGTRK